MSQAYFLNDLATAFYDNFKVTAKSFGELFIAAANSTKDVVVEWFAGGGFTSLIVVLLSLFFIVWALVF